MCSSAGAADVNRHKTDATEDRRISHTGLLVFSHAEF